MTEKMTKNDLPEMETTIIRSEEKKKRLVNCYKKISSIMGSQKKEEIKHGDL